MKYVLLNVLAVISLASSAAAAALWAGSFNVEWHLDRLLRQHYFSVVASRGAFHLSWRRNAPNVFNEGIRVEKVYRRGVHFTRTTNPAWPGGPSGRVHFNVAGVRAQSSDLYLTGQWCWTTHTFILPCWIPTVVFGSVAAVLLRRRRHRPKWDGVSRCAGCGYDLRASRGRCPECGRATASGTQVARTAAPQT
jgi:hypothetical protein